MDYLKKPLKARLALLKKHGRDTLLAYAPAYGYIATQMGNPPLRDVEGTVYSSNCPLRLRFHGWADELVKLGHKGYFVDNFQDETTRGMVFLLPHGRFLAGYSDPWNTAKDGGGPFNFEPCVYETAEQAASCADSLAERYAERCREDDAKQLAEILVESIRTEELPRLRNDVRELVADIRASTLAPRVCDAMREKLRAMLREMRKLRERAAALEGNYWLAVSN